MLFVQDFSKIFFFCISVLNCIVWIENVHFAFFLHYCLSTNFLHHFCDVFNRVWEQGANLYIFQMEMEGRMHSAYFLLHVKTSLVEWELLILSLGNFLTVQICSAVHSVLCRRVTSWRYLKRDLLNALPVIGRKLIPVSLWNSDLHASSDQLGDKCVVVLNWRQYFLLNGLPSLAWVKQKSWSTFCEWLEELGFFSNSLNVVFNCIGHSCLFNPRTLRFRVSAV